VRQNRNQALVENLSESCGDEVGGNQAGKLDQNVPTPANRHIPDQRHLTRKGTIQHHLGAPVQARTGWGLQPESLVRFLMRRRGTGFGSSSLKVRGETHIRHTLFRHGAKHLDRLLDGAGAVVHCREEMRMEIDHAFDRQDLRTEIANSSRLSGAVCA
jgi:hypothetical protein